MLSVILYHIRETTYMEDNKSITIILKKITEKYKNKKTDKKNATTLSEKV